MRRVVGTSRCRPSPTCAPPCGPRSESLRLAAAAKREYEASVSRAKAEADRLIENGNISYEKAVQEGIKEQQRLVSQTEVVQSATAEATRVTALSSAIIEPWPALPVAFSVAQATPFSAEATR